MKSSQKIDYSSLDQNQLKGNVQTAEVCEIENKCYARKKVNATEKIKKKSHHFSREDIKLPPTRKV